MHVEFILENAFTLTIPYVDEATDGQIKLISQKPRRLFFTESSEGQGVFQSPSNYYTTG